MSAVPRESEQRWLRWLSPTDSYHVRSECGKFSVARRTVNGVDWYVAYRIEATHAIELGATSVAKNVTDEGRKAAIREMKQLCEGEDQQPQGKP